LIYVKVFGYAFILKYYELFVFALLFFVKVFKELNVFKKRNTEFLCVSF